MWAEYRKRFVLTQVVILAMLIVLRVAQHYPWQALVFAFLVLQFFGFMGVRWSMRMKRKLQTERPLLQPAE
jgi:uncharacterized membrane protein YqjE